MAARSKKGHRRWFSMTDEAYHVCIRCECGAVFEGFVAWSQHSMNPIAVDAGKNIP
jgi:hypothetical protein